MPRPSFRLGKTFLTHVLPMALIATPLFIGNATSAAETPTLPNGSMSQGAAQPTGWLPPFTQAGTLALSRDTDHYHEGPASLKLESVGGFAEGNAGMPLSGAAGTQFVITGFSKADVVPGEGDDRPYASVALFVRDANGQTLRWEEIARPIGAPDWSPFRAQIDVPQEGTNVQLVVFLRGRGAVWLDEVELFAPADAPPASPILMDFDSPFQYGYGDWESALTVQDGVGRLEAESGRGGLGTNDAWDLTAHEHRVPSLRVRVDADHAAERVHLRLHDRDGTVVAWFFPLDEAPSGEWAQALPADGRNLNTPNRVDKPGEEAGLDLGQITQIELQGDWQTGAVRFEIDAIELVEPGASGDASRLSESDRQALREKRRELRRGQQASEAKSALEAQREAFLADVPRNVDSPRVVEIASVGKTLLAVTIDEGRIDAPPARPYDAKPGDLIERSEKTSLGVLPDGTVGQIPAYTRVVRAGRTLGWLNESTGRLLPAETRVGDDLFEPTVDDPSSYRVASEQNPAASQIPVAVYRKSRPIDMTMTEREPVMRHTLYLELAEPLEVGHAYQIGFPGVNTQRPHVDYRHDPDDTVTESIHVNQVGFHPADPYKQGFLSLWLGTGSTHAFDLEEYGGFEVVEITTGQVLFEAPVELHHDAEQIETIPGEKNHNATDVYALDFSAFDRPGEYCLRIPGLGKSRPFTIATDVWEKAFTVSMQGFLSHRSGIDLDPEPLGFDRPRGFHPQNGLVPRQVDITTVQGESAAVNAAFTRLLAGGLDVSKLTPVPEAWGGYMDAGDWDRRSIHLKATLAHLSLLDRFPEFFASLALVLPADEARNDLPDLLDEALFNLDFYRRLQRPDGGVRGGVESTEHPIRGGVSWEEPLLVGVFEADALTSYWYAAAALRASRALESFDSEKSAMYRNSGEHAWRWAMANDSQTLDGLQGWPLRQARANLYHAKMLAAAELLANGSDPESHGLFWSWYRDAQRDGIADRDLLDPLFAYAVLPESQAETSDRDHAVAKITALADVALRFGDGNAFGISIDAPELPVMGYLGYYAVPAAGSPSLLYAHAVTGDPKYLAGVIRSGNSALGANPNNRTYTTGLGQTYPQAPLHLDSRNTRQTPPPGITVYGPSDPSADFEFNAWMHDYFLQRVVPASRTWPTSEAYLDTFLWPSMNEYTIHQTIGPTSFYLGYLAACDRP
ncbi:MAG: glycoside hydrolase family 9 protein [Planctomycetota bacterium]